MKPNFAITAAAVAIVGTGAFLAGRSSVSQTAGAHSEDGPTRSSRTADGSSSARGDASGRTNRNGTRDASAAGAQDRPGTREARLAKLESIIRGEDPIERSRAMLAYLDQLDPSELKDAVDHFRSLGITDNRFGEYSMLLTAWAKADPTSALAYAKENTRGGFATDTILSAWAGNDPDAALAWAKANHNPDEGENPYLAGIIRGLASADPLKATELLTSMGFSEQRGEALAAILPHILSQGADAAREWISNIADDRLRDGAMSRVADQLAAKDPKGTADWLLANPGQATQSRMDDVLAAWTEKDKDGAIAYYKALPAGEARTNAFRGVVNTIAAGDPKAAVNFMDQNPADVNDRVVQQFAWHAFGEDPALAANNLNRITDPRERDRMYTRMIDAWIRRDSTAAQSWINSSQLPPAVLQHAQQSLGRVNQRNQ